MAEFFFVGFGVVVSAMCARFDELEYVAFGFRLNPPSPLRPPLSGFFLSKLGLVSFS